MRQHPIMARKRRATRPWAEQNAAKGGASTPSGRLGAWAGVGIVLMATALLYSPALNHGFTNWDDDRQVTANPDIRDLSPGGVKKMFSSFTVSLYQPLTSLAFALEYRLFGLDAGAYHAVNILLHLANILLVFRFVRSLSQRTGVAFTAAALFAVHPLQVEVVAWISSLSILLSSLFYLSAMNVYLAYVRSGKKYHFAGVWMLFLLAILAKTSAVTLPLVLLVIDLYLQRRTVQRILVEKVPLLAISLLFGYITMCARSGTSHIQDFAFRYSLLQRISIVSYSYLWYLGKLLFPVDLSAFYPFPSKTNGWLPVLFYMAPAILIGLAVGIWLSGRNRRLLGSVALFMMASLVLVIQVVPVSELMVCDRYAYIPSIGLFFLAGALVVRIGSQNLLLKGATVVGIGLVLALFSGVTSQRIGVWRDSLTLWNDVISKHTEIWAAYLNRGLAESQAGDYKAAIEDFNSTLRLNPNSEMALNNRAGCHAYLGEWSAALRDFDRAIRLQPNDDYFINRGIVKQKMGDWADAVRDFNTVLETHPQNIRALCERADSYRIRGSWAEAMKDYQAVLGLYPTHSHASFWFGAGLLERGDAEEAVAMLKKAISLGYREPGPAYFFLGRAYLELGQVDLAREALRRSHELGDIPAMVELQRMEGQ